MKKCLVFLLFLISLIGNSYGQFRWEDPLAVADIGLADKYGLLYNIAGLALGEILAADKTALRRWEWAISLEYQREYGSGNRQAMGYIGRARIGKQCRRWLQAGGEGQIMAFGEGNRFTTGFGGALYFNWFLLNQQGFRLSIDFAYGVSLNNRPFPQKGTRFNFTRYYGLHLAFKIFEGSFLQTGTRTFHMSNAYLFGDDRNPALDSFGLFIGVTNVF